MTAFWTPRPNLRRRNFTFDAELEVLFISLDAYNHLTGQSKTLGSDQVLVWCQGWQLPDTLTLPYHSFNPQELPASPAPSRSKNSSTISRPPAAGRP